MPSLMMTKLNLLMASGGEYASVLDRVHCIHYLTDFLADFSHLCNTMRRCFHSFPQNIQLCFDPTSASLRKSSTTSKPSLLEKSMRSIQTNSFSVYLKAGFNNHPSKPTNNTENSQSKIFGPIHRANASDITFIIYDIRPTNDRDIYLSN